MHNNFPGSFEAAPRASASSHNIRLPKKAGTDFGVIAFGCRNDGKVALFVYSSGILSGFQGMFKDSAVRMR